MVIKDLLERFVYIKPAAAPPSIETGLYHYMREHDGAYTRFHLRVEPDGAGMLIANATAAAQLTASGVVIAKGLLDEHDQADIIGELERRFRGASRDQFRTDLSKVQNLIRELVEPGGAYPIFNLEDAALAPAGAVLIAPLEADIPLAGPDQLGPILDRLWRVGIPHVTILVPEQPDPVQLVRAVERAEDLGLICGISGRGSDLLPGSLLDDLALAGLDHATVFFASAEAAVHDALFGEGDHAAAKTVFARTQQLEVADVGHVPLVSASLAGLDETLAALLELMVPNAAFYAIATGAADGSDGAIAADAMRQVAAQVEEDSNEAQVRYMWETPVKREPMLSLVDQVRRGPRCSGDVAVRIEPDGTVIPARGPYQAAGNILHDSWDAIWQHPAFRRYRERVEAPTRCRVCPGLASCAADCPAEPAGWAEGYNP
jgi:radical SAM protein with 4Fe4S-binding SPASM domain